MIVNLARRVAPAVTAANASRGIACALGLSLGQAALADVDSTNILVIGQLPDSRISLGKLTTKIVDTPQAISVVTADELQDRGINNLTDALRTVAGISLGAGETSWQGNNLVLRGFTTRNDTFLDGMRDYGYYFRDPFNSESIEVVKGPGSMLFGRGSTGGVINQVSKAPMLNGFVKAEIAAGTDDTRRATADIDVAIGATSAVRMTAMRHSSEVARRDGARSSRWGVAPTIAFGIGTPLRLQIGYLHQEENNRPDYGIPWFNGAPAKVERSNYYGFADDYLNTRVNVVTGKLEYDVTPGIMLRQQLRYSHDTRSFRTSEAVIPAGTAVTTPLTAITVTRNEFSGTSTDEFAQSQTDITARFTTGALRHTIVAGLELGKEKPQPIYIFHEGVITTNLANPLPQVFSETRNYVRLRARTNANSLGLFALDTMELGENWLAIAGLRWDRFDADYHSTGYTNTGAVAATTSINRVDSKASYRAALVYKPSEKSSVYASFATSFNPSAEGIESLVSAGRSVAQANINADPEKGRILEVGGKMSLLSDRLLLTTSIFSVRKSNVRIPNPTVANQNVNGGIQRVRGAEFEATGAITNRWTIRANYTHLDNETIAVSNAAAAGSPRVGAPLTIAPKDSASLQSDYAVTSRLQFGGGVIYQSARLGQNTVASYLKAPGYTIFEARLRYKLIDGLTTQVNVYNIGNKLYYDQLHPFHVVPGPGRSALFSLIWKR